jgi:hypothetical protein
MERLFGVSLLQEAAPICTGLRRFVTHRYHHNRWPYVTLQFDTELSPSSVTLSALAPVPLFRVAGASYRRGQVGCERNRKRTLQFDPALLHSAVPEEVLWSPQPVCSPYSRWSA